jgi:hypothetical protein
MYRGFPVGQVMFWQTGAEPGVRQIGIGDKAVPVPYHLIVDGQQRLTSLYAVTTGKPVVREDFTAARIKIAFNPFTELFAVPDATTEKQVEWLADITTLFDDFLDTVESYIERLGAGPRGPDKARAQAPVRSLRPRPRPNRLPILRGGAGRLCRGGTGRRGVRPDQQ